MKTYKQKIKLSKSNYQILNDYAHYSNNLYNYGLYLTRQYYFETGKYLGYPKLEKLAKTNDNYKLLPSQSSQQILRLIDKDFRSFFALLKKKNKGQYHNTVKLPRYKSKGKLFNIIFTFQSINLRDNKLSFFRSKTYKLKNKNKLLINFNHKIDGRIKQIIFKPINNGQYFIINIQYENRKKEKVNDLDKKRYLSIDLGINNLASCFDSKTGRSILLNGKPLKSYNRYYNKTMANYKSILKLINNKQWSKRLQNITYKRDCYIDNYFNQLVNKMIKYCINNRIGNIIVGYNKNWKQNINIGKINNQKFQYIPYLKLKIKIKNKCEENGINFEIIEESYTSKCSFLDNEPVKKSDNYLGKRIHRGLFISSTGRLINADINGSANIYKKVVDDVHNDQSIVDLMFNPIKINIF